MGYNLLDRIFARELNTIYTNPAAGPTLPNQVVTRFFQRNTFLYLLLENEAPVPETQFATSTRSLQGSGIQLVRKVRTPFAFALDARTDEQSWGEFYSVPL